MKLLIFNDTNCHYEIILNAIQKYDEILKISKNVYDTIYLDCKPNTSFIEYISIMYPTIIFSSISDYDFFINCTIYMPVPTVDDGKHFYITHQTCAPRLQKPNVFHLIPKNNNNYLKCDFVPFMSCKKQTSLPIYVVQGNINDNRRCYHHLKAILQHKYDYDFRIKILGRGELSAEFDEFKDKIITKYNLNFIDYHKEFIDVYGIFTLTSPTTHKKYYRGKLTSTINYALGYNLKVIIDDELNKIYNLTNSYVYEADDDKSLIQQFTKSLYDFYKL